MNWTEAQLQTIETRNKNILVSAAAGSGKTAVLIERIKQLMIKDKVDVDRFLITTFTNAAAAEMRERLEKALNMEMEKEDADKAFLRKQLMLMPSANISTFHTFALEVMRKFFYLTDLEPGFRIGDDTEVNIMKRESVEELFDKRFEEDYDDFTAFLEKYSSERSERRLMENIVSLYDQMRSIPDYFRWADERTELLASESPSEALGLRAFVEKKCIKAAAQSARCFSKAAELLYEAGLEKLYRKAQQDADMVKSVADAAARGGLQAFCELYGSIGYNQMRASKDEKEDYEVIKANVSSLRKKGKKLLDDVIGRYLGRSFDEYDEELRACHDDTVYMTGLMKELEVVFKEKKREKNIVDFDDVMHYAADILRDEMAAGEYRNKFRYIFIDEFQDSNMLQEIIAGRIAGEDNLFMVGDVKQSIYKFRLAEPEIFKAKYALYSRNEDDKSIKIDLSSNFRSKKSVTELVNSVFGLIMEGYDENSELKCTFSDEYPGLSPQLHIISKESGDSGFMGSSFAEAQQVVRLVEDSIGTEIFDAKMGVYRPAGYRDIAVLSRNRTMIGEIERVLNDSGVPAYGENTGGYFETVEIQVFINLLKLTDNSKQDVPLISVMRCPLFGFNVRELAEIRVFTTEGPYYKAVERYALEGPDEQLRIRIKALLEKMSYWRALKDTVSLEELIKTLLYDTGYFDYCSGLPVGKQRISNLRLLVERAGAFEASNYSGLYGFLSYIEALKNSRSNMGEARLVGENDDVVRVMTVHKSKGLEFPIVILAGAGRMIKAKGSGTSASMHKDLAIGMPMINRQGKWYRKTLLQRIIDAKKAEEEYEEEIRILYVAMTRAMDRLLVTAAVRNPDSLEEPSPDYKSYVEMMYEAFKESGGEVVLHNVEDMGSPQGRRISSRSRIAGLFMRSSAADSSARPEEIDRRLSFEYPYSGLDRIKSKYSVTELTREAAEEKHETRNDGGGKSASSPADMILNRPAFSAESRGPDAAQAGTAMHLVMERADFRQCMERGLPYIVETADALLENGELTEEERSCINEENIAAFFDDPVGKRAASALHLEKEREFILLKNLDGAETIVQGIIDCYFEEEGGLVLVDYKNSFVGGNIDESVIADRYRRQIELYKEAIEAAEGRCVKEAYLYLFELRKFVEIR